tara:strand:- start:13836 stop:14057 length:222 start_codon:yes stop_codon:yes gene_type:complete
MATLDELIINFEEKQTTHPHIAVLWQSYLKIQKFKMEYLLNKGNRVLENIDNNEDISLPLLITAYVLFTNNIT